MDTYSLSSVGDRVLLRELASLVARDRSNTALLLAHIAEVDRRGLYLPEGYPSMHAYCVGALHLSDESAYKRIRAARAARGFPAIFAAVAEGRLHLSAVVVLAPHLTTENCAELLAEAEHKRKREVEELIAKRFPQADVRTRLAALPRFAGVSVALAGGASSAATLPAATLNDQALSPQLAPGPVSLSDVEQPAAGTLFVHAADDPTVPGLSGAAATGVVAVPDRRSRLTPLAPARFALQVTIPQGTRDKLRHAQALLSHQIRSGDVAEVLDRALDALIARLEKRKLAAASRPRAARRPTSSKRHVPSVVRREVWHRDGGRCTFVSESGHRCEARERLEFDHAHEVARGGTASVANIRLRCRAHNQYAAECTFGRAFMESKRGRRAMPDCVREGPALLYAASSRYGTSSGSTRRARRGRSMA